MEVLAHGKTCIVYRGFRGFQRGFISPAIMCLYQIPPIRGCYGNDIDTSTFFVFKAPSRLKYRVSELFSFWGERKKAPDFNHPTLLPIIAD